MTRNYLNVADRHWFQSDRRSDVERYAAPDGREEQSPDQVLGRPFRTDNTDRESVEYSLSAHHRFILARLVANGGEASIVNLARDVATRLSGDPDIEVDSAQLRRHYLILRQTILEELTPQGAVEYCNEDGTVRVTLCEE